MNIEMNNPGITFAVSSGCFIRSDLPGGLPGVALNGWGRLTRVPHLPEVEETFRAAENFNIGVELVFRPDIGRRLADAERRRIVQVHAPIMWDIRAIFEHPFTAMGYASSMAAMLTTLGSVSRDMEETVAFAEECNSQIVMHPDAFRKLVARNPVLFQRARERLGIEADWRPMHVVEPGGSLEWRDEVVSAEISTNQTFANPDTSHTLITYNPIPRKILNTLQNQLTQYSDRIHGFHVSAVATNPDDPLSVYAGGGALPFNSSRLQPEHIAPLREFVRDVDQYAKKYQKRIPLVIEIYGWNTDQMSYDQRLNGVDATLNGLYTRSNPTRTFSYPRV